MRLKYAEITFYSWGCETVFDSGGKPVRSTPHPEDHHYHIISHRCGYLDDIRSYCWEHDLAHLFIEQYLFDRPSRVLLSIAEERTLYGAESMYEEVAAQTLQAFARANVEPIVAGVHWRALKREFISLADREKK
jgi:hypothetical protein